MIYKLVQFFRRDTTASWKRELQSALRQGGHMKVQVLILMKVKHDVIHGF